MRALATVLVLVTIAAGLVGHWLADAVDAVISAAIMGFLP